MQGVLLEVVVASFRDHHGPEGFPKSVCAQVTKTWFAEGKKKWTKGIGWQGGMAPIRVACMHTTGQGEGGTIRLD